MADDHDKLAKGDNAGSANASGTQGRPQSVWDMVGKKVQGQSGPLANLASGMDAADMAGQRAEDVTTVRPSQKVHSDLPAKTPAVAHDAPLRGGVEDNSDMKAGMTVIPPPTKPERAIQKDPAISLAGEHKSAEASQQASTDSPAKPVTKTTGEMTKTSEDTTKPTEALAKPTGDLTKPTGDLMKQTCNTPPAEQAALARPHEPAAQELKNSALLRSFDPVPVQKVVPEPHTPAARIRETEAQIPKVQGQLPEEKILTSKIESPAHSYSEKMARPVSDLHRIQVQERTIIPAPSSVPFEVEQRLVKVTDSKVFQAMASLSVLPLGRYLNTELKAPIRPSPHDSGHPIQLQMTGKTTGVTQLPALPSDHVQPDVAVLHSTDRSHSINEVAATEGVQAKHQSHSATQSNTAEELQPSGNIHSSIETVTPGEIHGTGDINSTGNINDHEEIDHTGEIDDTGEIDSAGEIDDTGEIEATERKHTAGKKHEPAGCVAKIYVVRGLIPDKRYITGGELAFVAIMALASASRVRPGEHAAEQGLSQTRREFVLVEEEPWLSPDYHLPPEKSSAGKALFADGRSESLPAKAKSAESVETESGASSASPEKAAVLQQRKILLRPQIIVQEGDNLAEMAEALFNDSRLGHLIADLNARTIDQRYAEKTRIVRLITRQRLSLPVYQDIIQFEATELSRVSDWDLITIVENTALDKELLDDHLSGMLGIKSNNRDPLM